MGKVVLNAADVGESPHVIMIRQGSRSIPSELMMKKIGYQEWEKFVPATGHVNKAGTLVVHAQETPRMHPSQYTEIMKGVKTADKQWGVEFLGSLGGIQKA
jgi:hypothetical protein